MVPPPPRRLSPGSSRDQTDDDDDDNNNITPDVLAQKLLNSFYTIFCHYRRVHVRVCVRVYSS